MDNITKFERILNLVERARNLDLMTAQVIGQINQQQVDLYKEIMGGKKEKVVKEEKSGTFKMRGLYTENNQMEKDNDMSNSTMTPNELMDCIVKAAEDIKKMKTNPPSSPTPPADTTPISSKDMETLNKLKQMSATVAEHLKVQVDIHKYAAAAITETHKLSFDLFKDIDEYMKSQH